MSKLDIRIKFANQSANKRHVDGPRHHMYAVCPDVGGEFDFPHYDGFFR